MTAGGDYCIGACAALAALLVDVSFIGEAIALWCGAALVVFRLYVQVNGYIKSRKEK